ncbi:MAG: hypothetical protein Q4C60_06810, partial [Eubacteriales bacterium]|nr:hypothetical protein [Eubacteriales bacterium]
RYTDETDGVGRGYEDDTDDAEREYAGRGYAEETGASGEDDEYLRQERRGRSRRGGRHDGGEFGGRRVPEDRDGEPEDGEESVLAEQDEAPVEDTQELPEFIREKYGDPEEMSESQKRELKREIEENRSQRRSSSDEERIRAMSREERALFGPYLSEKNSRRQIMQAIDNISLAACTGNVIVTGAEGAGTLNLAKGLIREIQLTDQNFSGKVARTTGAILNRRDVVPIIDKLKNGALIVEHASALSEQSVKNLRRELEKEERGLIVLLLDTKKAMDRFLERYGDLSRNFTARVDIRALDNDTLVRYAKAYARSQDYSIDEFGVLALHTRISSMQTIDHSVTMGEVREIVDDAMYYADKKTLAHLMDILLRRRYDEDDRIILREKDFMHY